MTTALSSEVRGIWEESRNFSQLSEASLALTPMNVLGSSTVKLLRALEPSTFHLRICCLRCGSVCMYLRIYKNIHVQVCTKIVGSAN